MRWFWSGTMRQTTLWGQAKYQWERFCNWWTIKPLDDEELVWAKANRPRTLQLFERGVIESWEVANSIRADRWFLESGLGRM